MEPNIEQRRGELEFDIRQTRKQMERKLAEYHDLKREVEHYERQLAALDATEGAG
jgi:hypothetical protein